MLKSNFIPLLFLFSLLISTKAMANVLYSSYVIELQWAGSVCALSMCSEEYTKGALSNVFNLHGLWPGDQANAPENCPGKSLNISTLPDELQGKLLEYWSGLNGTQQAFLNHEWTKHGTCWNPFLGNIEKMPQQVRKIVRSGRNYGASSLISPIYFLDLAVSLASELNPWKVLKQAGIEPSQTLYSRDSILEALSKAYLVTSYSLICTQDENGHSLLKGIRLTLDINLQPMEDELYHNANGCEDMLYYPPWNSGYTNPSFQKKRIMFS